MKKLAWIAAAGAMALAACSTKNESIAPGVADVASAMENLSEITTSRLGKTLRFIPLETTDSSLVGSEWTMRLADGKVIIANAPKISYGNDDADVLVFDINTGKFLNKIGRYGNGPEDFRFAHPSLDRAGKYSYFSAGNSKGWVKYTLDGKFCGKVCPELTAHSHKVVEIDDSTLLVANDEKREGRRSIKFKRFNFNGNPVDSFSVFDGQPAATYNLNFEGSLQIHSCTGGLPKTSQSVTILKNNGRQVVITGGSYYHVGNEFHIHETLCDTVYSVTPQGAVPSLTFNLGENGFPFNQVNIREIRDSEIIVSEVLETPTYALFGLIKGDPTDKESTEYIGFFDRATGSTTVTTLDDGIRDDLRGFMPFSPVKTLPDGSIVGVISMDEIGKWMDDNPDAEMPEELADLDPEANPVLVVISTE